MTPTEPPSDAEDWGQEQWIEWLNATDHPPSDDDTAAPVHGPQPTMRSLLGSAMRGLHDAIYGPREDEVVIEVGSGDPGGPDGMTVHLDEDEPTLSWVRIRRTKDR